MKLISFILSIIMLFSGFSVAAESIETKNFAGPREIIFAEEGNITDEVNASLFTITEECDTVKSLSTTLWQESDDCFTINVNDDSSISFSGNTGVAKRKYGVYLSSARPSKLSNIKTSDEDGNYSGSFAKSKIPSGVSYLWVYYKDTGSEIYYLEFDAIPIIKKSSGEVGIFKSEVTDSNIKTYNDYNGTDLIYYTQINKYCLTEDDDHYFDEYKAITDKAKEITKGKSTQREKALAVHDWLCDNLYYDYDALYAGDISDAANPRLVFETKRAVCSGFSRLMSIMLRSVGVPCIDVTGFAYNFPSGYTWNDLDHSQPNHEWNMFHDGERWCIVDATWDCSNRFEDNTFVEGSKTHTYFDVNETFFAYTHEVHSYFMKRNEYYSRYDLPAYGGVVYRQIDDDDFYTAYDAYGDFDEYIIKDKVCGLPVKKIADYFMFEHSSVEHIYVPSSVDEFGYAAFYGCNDLEKFEYPGNDLIIGDFVLYDCDDDLTVYARYNSDLYKYAKDEYIRVKIMGKPKVSKIEAKGSSYDIYYTYASLAPKEKMFCVVKDENGNLKEVKIFNIDYALDHITFTPHESGNVGAYIFDNTLEP